MTAYDFRLFDPPAPIAAVTIRNRSSGQEIRDVPMLLDTGADVTLLPQGFVERIGISIDSTNSCALKGYDGSESTATVVQAELVFMSRVFRGQFVVAQQEWGIIGRN